MRRLSSLTVSSCVLVGVVGCQSNSLTNPVEIIGLSQAALAEVTRVSYRAEYEGTGWVKPLVATVDGDVVMGPKSQWDIESFRCDVTLQTSDSDEKLHFVSGTNGDVYFLVDPKTKIAHEDMDPAVLGTHGRNIQRVLVRNFVSGDLFGEDVKPESLEFAGSQRVAGVDCYRIRIKSDSPPEMVWSLSKKDFLPRRVLRIYPNRRDPEGDPGTTQLTLTNVVANPNFDEDPFVLHLPAGFTKTDDFAP